MFIETLEKTEVKDGEFATVDAIIRGVGANPRGYPVTLIKGPGPGVYLIQSHEVPMQGSLPSITIKVGMESMKLYHLSNSGLDGEIYKRNYVGDGIRISIID